MLDRTQLHDQAVDAYRRTRHDRQAADDAKGLDGRVDQYVRDFFKLDAGLPLNDGMTAGDVPGWDSLANVNFLMGLGQAFGAKFDIETIAAMRSIGDVRRELRRHANAAAGL